MQADNFSIICFILNSTAAKPLSSFLHNFRTSCSNWTPRFEIQPFCCYLMSGVHFSYQDHQTRSLSFIKSGPQCPSPIFISVFWGKWISRSRLSSLRRLLRKELASSRSCISQWNLTIWLPSPDSHPQGKERSTNAEKTSVLGAVEGIVVPPT